MLHGRKKKQGAVKRKVFPHPRDNIFRGEPESAPKQNTTPASRPPLAIRTFAVRGELITLNNNRPEKTMIPIKLATVMKLNLSVESQKMNGAPSVDKDA